MLQAITSGELGGAQVHLASMVRDLVAAGIAVEVACGPGEFLPRTLRDVARVQLVPWLRSTPTPYGDSRAFAALARLARGSDVVHTHSAKAGALGRVAARAVGVPKIMHTSHGSFLGERRSRLAVRALLGAERLAAASTTHLFVLSRADLELMRAHGLYRDTPWDLVRIAPERVSRPSGRWSYRDRRKVIAVVANHYPNKGIDVLLRAMPQITASSPDVRIRLAGDGPVRGELETLVRQMALDRVEFLGRRDDPTDVLLDAAVFVLPSRKEGLPIALLEALAVGVPAVASRVGAVGEIVREGEVLLVPPDDPHALGNAVTSVLRDGALARALSAGGQAAAARFVAGAGIGPILAAYTDAK